MVEPRKRTKSKMMEQLEQDGFLWSHDYHISAVVYYDREPIGHFDACFSFAKVLGIEEIQEARQHIIDNTDGDDAIIMGIYFIGIRKLVEKEE